MTPSINPREIWLSRIAALTSGGVVVALGYAVLRWTDFAADHQEPVEIKVGYPVCESAEGAQEAWASKDERNALPTGCVRTSAPLDLARFANPRSLSIYFEQVGSRDSLVVRVVMKVDADVKRYHYTIRSALGYVASDDRAPR